jgi:myo-inositol-1(or 4)-monophosphatase
LGAIFDFNRNEVFTGIVGAGAWLNGAPMRVSDTAQVGQAVLCTGFPVAMDYSAASLSRFVRLVQQYKKIRLLGSAALSLAYVAAGRVEAYFEQKIRPWDVAAGVAVVRAAGGMVTMAGAGSESSPLTVYASNAHLPSVALD